MQCINSYRAAKPSAVGSTFVDGGIALYAIDLFGSLLTLVTSEHCPVRAIAPRHSSEQMSILVKYWGA